MNYPGINPNSPFTDLNGASVSNNRLVNVPNAFRSLPNSGQYIRCRFPTGLFPKNRYTGKFGAKNDKLKNHFQGIVRLKDGVHFLVSAADSDGPHAVLLLFQIKSHLKIGASPTGPVRSNLIFSERNTTDNLVQLFHINKGAPDYWHPGCLGIMGDIVSTPLENYKETAIVKTKVVFYNFIDPLHPVQIPITINMDNRYGAVSTCRLPDNKFLCALCSNPEKKFRFYLSKTTKLTDGFESNFDTEIKIDDIKNKPGQGTALHEVLKDKKFQSIQLVQDKTGKLFMIITGNLATAAPFQEEFDYSILVQIDYTKSTGRVKDLIFLDLLLHEPNKKYVNFDAGVGLYIPDEKQIALYNIHHYRRYDHVRLAEYYSRSITNPSKSNDEKDSFIELYSNLELKDRCLNLYGKDIRDIPNYKEVIAQTGHFNDKARSLRFRLPEGVKYELYQNDSYNKNGGFHLTLLGTGKVVEYKDLRDRTIPGLSDNNKVFDFQLSSSRYV